MSLNAMTDFLDEYLKFSGFFTVHRALAHSD